MTSLAPVCVLLGGLGTRLGSVVSALPKALVPVAGRPFLHHQLALLAEHGAHRVVLCTGHLGHLVEESVGDGSAFGLDVRYSPDGPHLLGTAGAVRQALPLLGDRFLLTYGDTYLTVDQAAVLAAAESSGRPALMTVLRNEGRWDTSNVEYAGGTVLRYNKVRPDGDMHYIDYGLSVLTPASLQAADDADLAGVFHALAAGGKLAGYLAEERFYEIGTPQSLAEADDYLRGRDPLHERPRP